MKISVGKIRKEAKMQTALKRWLDVTLRFPDTIELKVMLQQQANVQAQLRLVRNLLWRKAPATLLKRVNSLCRYMAFLGDAGIPFPGSEDILYQFMVTATSERSGHKTFWGDGSFTFCGARNGCGRIENSHIFEEVHWCSIYKVSGTAETGLSIYCPRAMQSSWNCYG